MIPAETEVLNLSAGQLRSAVRRALAELRSGRLDSRPEPDDAELNRWAEHILARIRMEVS